MLITGDNGKREVKKEREREKSMFEKVWPCGQAGGGHPGEGVMEKISVREEIEKERQKFRWGYGVEREIRDSWT